jgi:hypothetical protein
MQSEAEQWRQQPRFSRFTVRQDRAANELKARPRSFRVNRARQRTKFRFQPELTGAKINSNEQSEIEPPRYLHRPVNFVSNTSEVA